MIDTLQLVYLLAITIFWVFVFVYSVNNHYISSIENEYNSVV
jgi:hypothetical protein